LPSGTVDEQVLEALPGKVPLIKKTYRPPNYETPVSFFNEPYTPNNAFFVRYHLADIPELDSATWKVRIGGLGAERQLELTLADLENNYSKVEPTRMCREWSGATAPSATLNGAAFGSRMCSTKSA
jgi:hypothetical protein